jgi:hypothetical protein
MRDMTDHAMAPEGVMNLQRQMAASFCRFSASCTHAHNRHSHTSG